MSPCHQAGHRDNGAFTWGWGPSLLCAKPSQPHGVGGGGAGKLCVSVQSSCWPSPPHPRTCRAVWPACREDSGVCEPTARRSSFLMSNTASPAQGWAPGPQTHGHALTGTRKEQSILPDPGTWKPRFRAVTERALLPLLPSEGGPLTPHPAPPREQPSQPHAVGGAGKSDDSRAASPEGPCPPGVAGKGQRPAGLTLSQSPGSSGGPGSAPRGHTLPLPGGHQGPGPSQTRPPKLGCAHSQPRAYLTPGRSLLTASAPLGSGCHDTFQKTQTPGQGRAGARGSIPQRAAGCTTGQVPTCLCSVARTCHPSGH